MKVMMKTSANVALICAASYDQITCFMRSLLSEIVDDDYVLRRINLQRADTSFDEILPSDLSLETKVALIFCGHGTDEKLLTGAEQDCSRLSKSFEEGVFYDFNSFKLGPQVLAALACNAGAQLGRDFVEETGGTFFGYVDKLCFIITDSETYNFWWRKIFTEIIRKIIRDQEITEGTIELAQALYRDALEFFSSGNGRYEEKALGMRMCLRRNLEALCRY